VDLRQSPADGKPESLTFLFMHFTIKLHIGSDARDVGSREAPALIDDRKFRELIATT